MKKIICVLLVATVLSGILCGCKPKKNQVNGTTDILQTSEQSNAEQDTPIDTLPSVLEPATTADTQTEEKFDKELYSPLNEYTDGWITASMKENVNADDENWLVIGDGLSYSGEYAEGANDGMFDFVSNIMAGPEEKYGFEFDLKLSRQDSSDRKTTVFVGLRVQSVYLRTAESSSGIWLALNSDSIGIYTGSWNAPLNEINLPLDFSDFRRVSITDDQAENVIYINLQLDDETQLLVCKISVRTENGNTVLDAYTYKDGCKSVYASVSQGSALFTGGYVKLWNNRRNGVCFKNVAYRLY